MSYGMMIAVQLDKKDIFDRIWRWSKKYMQHQEGPLEGYFAWSCKTDGTRNAEGPASDGELYFITSLIFASNRWGNDTGINYRKEAQHILDCSFKKSEYSQSQDEHPASHRAENNVMPLSIRRTISSHSLPTDLAADLQTLPITSPPSTMWEQMGL